MRNIEEREGLAEVVHDECALILSSRKCVHSLLLISALCLPACDKPESQVVLDSGRPEVTLSVTPTAYSQFEKGTYRAEFAADFTKDMKLNKGPDGFFMKPDYQWKLEEALEKASAGEAVPDEIFRQMDNAVLAEMLEKLFDDWAKYQFPDKNQALYRSPYVQHLYRHYRNLRYLEVLPEQPARRGKGDIDKLIDVWSEHDQKAWELTLKSPFFGTKKDPGTAGPLEKPLMPLAQKLMTEMTERFQNHDSFDFKAFYLSKIQHAVLDIILPGITLEAIRDRQKRAGFEDIESSFSEKNFETELKKAFMVRAVFFRRDARRNAADAKERKIYEMIGAKFRELGQMEHPLDLYRHD